ncbi:MAG: glycogen synthase GlgA [Caulobacteraceae bacterium]|nr:glycogen synthase GlgA [Caulobacteraceae bacterium]
MPKTDSPKAGLATASLPNANVKVLVVASEIYPLIKTGGLADVVGALPEALKAQGVAVRTLVPGYPAVMKALKTKDVVHAWPELFGGPARLIAAKVKGLDLLVLDAPHLYDRAGGPYSDARGRDFPDNGIRFAALSKAAGAVGQGQVAAFVPDVVHAHDWQAGLTAAYLVYGEGRRAPSVMTLHNLAFQGQFARANFPLLGLPDIAFSVQGVEYYGDVGYLKAGLGLADRITTVSPTYADEICTPEGGMGLDGLLRGRADRLSGILNGIDPQVWDPAEDQALESRYDSARLAARRPNKTALLGEFALAPGAHGPLFAVVSRLSWQKGLDLLLDVLPTLEALDAQLVVLGTGEPALEAGFRAAAADYPGRIGVRIGYDEVAAHHIQAGADALIVPSRFEPCGLTQLCALRYGCVPVVARVGGLNDTVIDASPMSLAANAATGVQIAPYSAAMLQAGLRRTAHLHAQPEVWAGLQTRGMATDVSWQAPAARYAALYRSLTIG